MRKLCILIIFDIQLSLFAVKNASIIVKDVLFKNFLYIKNVMDKVKELYNIDIKENEIRYLDNALLAILLKDKTSGKNLIWATDTYAWRGIGFEPQDFITIKSITGLHGNIIKPRTEKSQKEQRQRIKNKAEVFTPSWVCNRQNNLVDNAWFGRENIFNIETVNGWQTKTEKVLFPDTVFVRIRQVHPGRKG